MKNNHTVEWKLDSNGTTCFAHANVHSCKKSWIDWMINIPLCITNNVLLWASSMFRDIFYDDLRVEDYKVDLSTKFLP